jgi:imidazolonepropionase-like amidohydrolase
MRRLSVAAAGLTIVGLASVGIRSQAPSRPGPTLYEGARLILGDVSAPIENGALLVESGRIRAIGRRGEVAAPAGAARVDLSGKTVMPAIVNAHAHFGYEKYTKAEGEALPGNWTPKNLLDHLEREAFYGVGTVNDGGSSPVGMALQFQADQTARTFPPAAQFWFNAGIVPPEGGPDAILIKGTRPLHADYEVTRATEARAAVADVHAKGVRQVKVWFGDRGGSYPAMPPQVYEAVIDEAHKDGIYVHAHATTLRDQKDALRAGVDVLVHMVQNAPIDDELRSLIQQHTPYWATVIALGDRPDVCDDDPFFTQSLSASIIADIKANACRPNPSAAAREQRLSENFMAMIHAGARLVLGTDAGIRPGDTFGSGDHHEIEHWVAMGLSPADAIIASTSRPAEALRLDDVGTLAVGKRADFLVLDANPLDDIHNLRKIADVYLDGAKLDRAALLAKWQHS